MTDRIYKILTADVPAELPASSVLIAQNATEDAYLVGEPGFTDWDAIGTIVGSWDQTTGLQEGQSYDTNVPPNVIGVPTHPVTADYTGWINPLGNTDDGRATGELDSMRWQGHVEQKYLQDDMRYPASQSPFTLKIERQNIGVGAPAWNNTTTYSAGDYVTNGGSTWQSLQDGNLNQTPFGGSTWWTFINTPGWSWRVSMISADPFRDITARAIGVYSDPECTSFLFTTGSFVDAGGLNYFTECPAGQRTANPDQVNFALLLGSAQEGYFNLPAGSPTTEALFWQQPQLLTVTPTRPQVPDYMKITKYGARYGAKLSDGSLIIHNPSPDGYQVREITVGANDKVRLILVGNNRDNADPIVTLRRVDNGQSYTFGMVWAGNQYVSGVEPGLHTAASGLVGYFRIVGIEWN